MIKIAGGDYITFSGIDLQENAANTTNRTDWGYAIVKASATDGAKNINITNCVVTLNKANTSSVAIYGGNHLANSVTTLTIADVSGINENIKINGCTISNSYNGIQIFGFTTTAAYYDAGLEIGFTSGNTVSNYGGGGSTTYGIYGTGQNAPKIENNTVTLGAGTTTTAYGIYLAGACNGYIKINTNIVSVASSATSSQLTAITSLAATTTQIDYTNNIIQNCSYLTATSGNFQGIYEQGATTGATVNITGNTISGLNYSTALLAGSGTIYGIYYSKSTTVATNVNVTNNIITGLALTGTTGSTVNIIYLAGGTNQTVNNNQIYNNTIDGTGTTGTIYCMRLTTGTIVANNNSIHDNRILKATGTGTIYGIYDLSSPTNENFNSNTIYNLTSAGASTIGGIYTNTATGVRTVSLNNIYAFASAGGTVYGIYQASSSPNIFKNNVYDLSSSAAASLVYGIYISSGTTVNIYNNFVSDLRTPAATSNIAISGIYVSGGTTVGLYYNTVYLNASSSAVTFGTAGVYASTTPTLDMRDNVVVNVSTPGNSVIGAKTVAYRRSSATLTTYAAASNNNDFFAGTPDSARVIFFDGVSNDQTISDYKTRVTPRDGASFTENPPFLNVSTTPYDLHMSTVIATQCESGGTPVSTPVAITDDFDGFTRNATTPDVGADEFIGTPLDLTAPVISYTPLLNTSGTGNRTLVVTVTDPAGVPTTAPGWPYLYWRINAGSWTGVAPTGVVGSQYSYSFGAGVVTGDVVQYYAVAQDVNNNVGAFPSAGAGGFTTNPPAAATPPTTPSSYIVSQAALAGSYTVGSADFAEITGMNITFEKVVTTVMKEVDVEIQQDNVPVEKGQVVNDATSTSMSPVSVKKLMPVEEISWRPMLNGTPYTGDLFVKKAEHPELNFDASIEGVYATITAAVADLNLRGVAGATTFLLTDASYLSETLPITINVANEGNFPTATNTVTIKPNTGVTALVQGAGAATQVIKVLNSYVTIDGSNAGGTDRSLTFENTSVTTPQVVVFGSTGTTPIVNGTLKNCNIINGITSSSAIVVSDGTVPGTAGYFNNITIQNNSIQKAYMGAYCNAVVAAGNGSGLSLTNNNLDFVTPNHIALCGLYVQGVDGATVTNNLIGNYTTTYASNITGIWFATGTVNSTISNNTIGPINITTAPPRGIVVTSNVPNAVVNITNNIVTGLVTSYSGAEYGIYVFSGTGGVMIQKNRVSNFNNTSSSGYSAIGIALGSTLTAADITAQNNFIWGITAYGYASTTTDNGFGINLLAGGGYKLYHNTVAMTVEQTIATGNPAAIIINSAITTAGSLDIRDNIFANFLTGGANTYAILSNAANTVFSNINYNDYHSAGPNLGYIGGVRLNLDSLRLGTAQDLQSVSGDPKLSSLTDLHINVNATSPVNNAGLYFATVAQDIDGDTRNNPPDIGADEYTYVAPTVLDPTDVAATAISQSEIDVAFTKNGNNNNVVIVWNADGVFTTPSGTPPAVGQPFAGGTMGYNGGTSPFAHTGLPAATLYYYKVFSYDGAFYSPGLTASATTFCGIITTFPFAESFDNVTFAPTCWLNIQASGSGLWTRSTAGTNPTTTPHSGLGMAEYASYDYSSGASAILVTPQITFAGDGYQVNFWMYRDNGYLSNLDRVAVYYNATPDTTGATLLGTINRSITQTPVVPANGWYNYKFSVPTGTTGNAYIFFRGTSAYGNNMFIDDVTIEEKAAKDISVSSITFTQTPPYFTGNPITVNAIITNNGTEANPATVPLTYKEGSVPASQGDGVGEIFTPSWVGNTANISFTVNYTPATVGVKTINVKSFYAGDLLPENDLSSKSATVVAAGSLWEDFTDVSALAKWTIVNLDSGASIWERNTSKYNSSPASAGSYYESSTLQNNDWLISPKLVVSSGDSLTFFHSIQSATYPESLYVKIGTTNDPNTGTWTNLAVILDNSTTWKYKKYDMTPWAGQNVYVAFVNRSLDAWVLFVDDITGPVVYVPAVDLAFTDFWQASGLPVPGDKVRDTRVTLNTELGTKPSEMLSPFSTGTRSSGAINTSYAFDSSIPLLPELAPISVKGVIKNYGLNAATYNLAWSVSGTAQTPYSGPSVGTAGSDTASLSYTPSALGTFLTAGAITVTADENPGNDANSFRMRVYPDAFARTIYDRGDNIVDTYIGWGNDTTYFKAGVRYTAASNIKLAGVDFICRTELATGDQFIVQVRAADTVATSPGAVLYTKIFTAADYYSGAGDYMYFPFGADAPTIASGSDYWITVKAPIGIAYPGGAHNTGFTPGRSFYQQSADTTLWSALVITTERAWMMRAVHIEGIASTFQLTVNVGNGWNMVSIPGLLPTNQNVLTWWPGKDPAAGVFKFQGGYQAVTVAAPGTGYWMKNVGAQTYNTGDEWPVDGINIVAHDPIPALLGWNLIGGYEQSVATINLTTTPPGLITGSVYKYSGGYVAATTLDPGYGYWIKLTAAGSINIPSAIAGPTKAIAGPSTEGFGKIIITDSQQKSYSLYTVQGEADLTQFDLPPYPPQGMFDVRYSSQRYAERLSSTAQAIEMAGVQYPVRVKAEGTSIILSDETGREVARLKAGEEVTLNTAVGKLMVAENVIPASYSLEQNYPNPFNPSTVIQFSIPEDVQNVKLIIYSALGEKVAELVNTGLQAGIYKYNWNASNVSSGMYIYQVVTEKFVSTKKMMLLK